MRRIPRTCRDRGAAAEPVGYSPDADEAAPGETSGGALARAVADLIAGLGDDEVLITQAERRCATPDWSLAVVVGDLPHRYRAGYDARLARLLRHAGTTLVHDWSAGRAAPNCPAQFLLARWLLNRAVFIAQCGSGVHLGQVRGWARELGLADRAEPERDVIAEAPDSWLSSWGLGSVRVDPANRFTAAVSCSLKSPDRRQPQPGRAGTHHLGNDDGRG